MVWYGKRNLESGELQVLGPDVLIRENKETLNFIVGFQIELKCLLKIGFGKSE